jgi:hypothetical protein
MRAPDPNHCITFTSFSEFENNDDIFYLNFGTDLKLLGNSSTFSNPADCAKRHFNIFAECIRCTTIHAEYIQQHLKTNSPASAFNYSNYLLYFTGRLKNYLFRSDGKCDRIFCVGFSKDLGKLSKRRTS